MYGVAQAMEMSHKNEISEIRRGESTLDKKIREANQKESMKIAKKVIDGLGVKLSREASSSSRINKDSESQGRKAGSGHRVKQNLLK